VGVGETRGEVHHLLKGIWEGKKPVGKAAPHTACRKWMSMNLTSHLGHRSHRHGSTLWNPTLTEGRLP
jgi:hypothetical protein